MGVWGPGLFDNDYALDWLGEIGRGDSIGPVRRVLEDARTAENLMTHEAMEVVAAAALVLAALGYPTDGLPPEARTLALALKGSVSISTATLAVLALTNITSGEPDIYQGWLMDTSLDQFVLRVDELKQGLLDCAIKLGL